MVVEPVDRENGFGPDARAYLSVRHGGNEQHEKVGED